MQLLQTNNCIPSVYKLSLSFVTPDIEMSTRSELLVVMCWGHVGGAIHGLVSQGYNGNRWEQGLGFKTEKIIDRNSSSKEIYPYSSAQYVKC